MVKSDEKETSPEESIDSYEDCRRTTTRTTGRVKKPKAIFDPSEANVPKIIQPGKALSVKTTAKVVQLGAKSQQAAAITNKKHPLRIHVIQKKSVTSAQTSKMISKPDSQAIGKKSENKNEEVHAKTEPESMESECVQTQLKKENNKSDQSTGAPVTQQAIKKEAISSPITQAIKSKEAIGSPVTQAIKSRESIGSLLAKSITTSMQRTVTPIKAGATKQVLSSGTGTATSSALPKIYVSADDGKTTTRTLISSAGKSATATGIITSTTRKLDNSTSIMVSNAQRILNSPRVKTAGGLVIQQQQQQQQQSSPNQSTLVLQSGSLQRIQSGHVTLTTVKPILTATSIQSPRATTSAIGGANMKLLTSPPVRTLAKQLPTVGTCNIQKASATSPQLEVSSVRQAVKRAANSTQDELPRKLGTLSKMDPNTDMEQSDRDYLMSFLPFMRKIAPDEKLRMRQQIMKIFLDITAAKYKSEGQDSNI